MQDNWITIIGNVVTTPTLRCTSNGVPVAGFRLASTPRRFDRTHGEWRDGETLFISVNCWRGLADHVCSSLDKGDPVVVSGRLAARSYVAGEDRRTTMEIEATAVGPDLNRVDARPARTQRGRAVGGNTADQSAPVAAAAVPAGTAAG